MNHAELLNAARAAAIPLPIEDHPQYQLVLQGHAQAELMRREARRTADGDLYNFVTNILGYAEMHEPLRGS